MLETPTLQKSVNGVSHVLNQIFESLNPDFSIPRVETYAIIADRLNAVSGASWQWRYISNVAAGRQAPSAAMERAVHALAATLDGLPAHIATATQATVYQAQGVTVRSGSLVLMDSHPCGWIGCPVHIISRSKYCCDDHRRKARNFRAKQHRQAAR